MYSASGGTAWLIQLRAAMSFCSATLSNSIMLNRASIPRIVACLAPAAGRVPSNCAIPAKKAERKGCYKQGETWQPLRRSGGFVLVGGRGEGNYKNTINQYNSSYSHAGGKQLGHTALHEGKKKGDWLTDKHPEHHQTEQFRKFNTAVDKTELAVLMNTRVCFVLFK